jgi:hypothetical protein
VVYALPLGPAGSRVPAESGDVERTTPLASALLR